MVNSNIIPMKVDGTEFELVWTDLGSKVRLSVFKDRMNLGHKDFPLATDTGRGVIEYTVRSILRGKDEKATNVSNR